jgi:geranylgeranyl diphosphate synthase type I
MMSEPGVLAIRSLDAADELNTEAEMARAVLKTRRAVLDPFLREAVATLPDAVRGIAGYHLGWLDENGGPVVADSGKAIRPTMALLAAEAVGASAEVALPAAAAVELAHNFSLIHDDVIDGDETRRHRPTVWALFGVGAAVLAGDALLALAYEVLAASGHHAATAVAARLSTAVIGLCEGQSQDLSFERRSDVDLSECLGMVERKTALLMSCACASGAAFGGARPCQVERMGSVGRHLGLAFQLVDDLLGIWGDPAVTGKPVYSDLQNRKKTLPVVAALTSGTAAGRELAELYDSNEKLADGDVVRAAELIERAGALHWSEAELQAFLSRALRDLDLVEPTASGAAALRSLGFLISSQHR